MLMKIFKVVAKWRSPFKIANKKRGKRNFCKMLYLSLRRLFSGIFKSKNGLIAPNSAING
jgi:hypothetical protein